MQVEAEMAKNLAEAGLELADALPRLSKNLLVCWSHVVTLLYVNRGTSDAHAGTRPHSKLI